MPGGGSKRGERRGGRTAGTPNKATAEVRAYAGEYTKAAIDGLVKVARSSKSDQAKVAAWREILDRAVGRPAQAVIDADGVPEAPPKVTFLWHELEGATNRT